MAKRVYVGKLSYDTTESALTELFTEFGEVVSVNLITDRDSGRSKGFAFVEMADDAAAQQAIEQVDGREVDGRNIAVAEARPKRDDRGGRGGGGRRDDRRDRGGRRDERW